MQKILQSAAVLTLGILLTGMPEPVMAQNSQDSVSQRLTLVNQEVCLQNWDKALNLINQIIGSETLPANDRSFYVDYRRTLLNYRDHQTPVEELPGCAEILSNLETTQQPEQTESAPSDRSPGNPNFNWAQEIANITNRTPASRPNPSPASNPQPSNPAIVDPVIASPEVTLSEEQGVWLRPVPTSNVPASRIQGSLSNRLPITAENIIVYYDIYKHSTTEGANGSNVYTCEQAHRFQRVADDIPANAQRSISIQEPDRFVQVIGIVWEENGNRAFVRVSDFKNTGNVRPCLRWFPGSYSRQAIDPRIRLR
jgi:hypothetical protein